MPLYPFCVIDDVQSLNPHRPTYGASTKPTSIQVKKFMLDIYSQILSICQASGYDIDNLHETSSTVALAITAGDDTTIALADATGISEGDIVNIKGVTSGLRAWEFCEVETVSSNNITMDISNSYDAGSSVYLINNALNTLRKINAYGAAWMAEESAFMGTAVNRSDHADALKEYYFGNEENMSGLWAIRNIPGFLIGASTTDEAQVIRSSLTTQGSYYGELDGDIDSSAIDPEFEKDMKF